MKELSVMFLEGGTNACETSQDENTKKAKQRFVYSTGASSQDQSLWLLPGTAAHISWGPLTQASWTSTNANVAIRFCQCRQDAGQTSCVCLCRRKERKVRTIKDCCLRAAVAIELLTRKKTAAWISCAGEAVLEDMYTVV
ncbi:hypothetical protein AV530_004943 [Patagioenas fasciata monilis]|uniref:Uncharacterized protein n=1 Tax=Patagioenas fasciata monilis TaxID=372326 RepID=A0A1V4K3Q5_PATFA|nr:hypothetical protein AV530_004943 [Patagioenas fasciata monilis]